MRQVLKEKFAGAMRTVAVVVLSIILSLIGLNVIYGSAAEEERGVQRAQLCVLAIPPDIRLEGHLNRVCLVNNGLEPFDIDGNGEVAVDPDDGEVP